VAFLEDSLSVEKEERSHFLDELDPYEHFITENEETE
jgi:hypothetical protein